MFAPMQEGLRLLPADPVQISLDVEAGRLRLDQDGLLARVVKPHSLDKRHYVFRYADILGTAMRRKFPLWWVELFAGPGRLWVAGEERFCDGSPLDALSIRHPLSGYVFADLDPRLTDALGERVAGHDRNVHVLTGDANSENIRREVFRIVPRDALVTLYLDPEGLELKLATIDAFARHYEHLDLLVNFPVTGLVRYLKAASGRPVLAASVLGIPDPERVVSTGADRANIRSVFHQHLDELRFVHRSTQPIRTHLTQSPLYDLLCASRNHRAPEFFESAKAIAPGGQRRFELGL
jgi:three-Cys-motif partner protein